MKVNCKKCGQILVVTEDLVGQQVRCPKCEFVVEVVVDELSQSQSDTKSHASELRDDSSWESGKIDSDRPAPHASHAPVAQASQQLELNQPVHEPLKELEVEPEPWEFAKEWFLKIPEGLEFGPATLEQLDQWVSQGRVSGNCQVRYDDEGWQAAHDFYPELVEAGNPFGQVPAAAAVVSTSSQPARHMEPHRGKLVLGLAIAGCVVPFLSVWPAVIGTRDLRQMSLGKMDPSGNAMTRSGQAIAMVASMIWFGAFAIGLLAILIATMNGLSQ